ncbi:MAG TPA: hypothetical protein VEX68_22570 [Bryobacteraceae bacterium]|nr:hypothetical protein [Bryobacteraceae bacterium]
MPRRRFGLDRTESLAFVRARNTSTRGIEPRIVEGLKALESNAFTIVDLIRDKCEFRMYRWNLDFASKGAKRTSLK